MTPEPVSVVVAVVSVVSAVVAAAATIYGMVDRRRTFASQQAELKRQAERWQREFASDLRRQEVQLRTQFYLEQYRFRLSSYSRVFRTLGAVVSVEIDRESNRLEVLPPSEELQSTADALYEHLYGEPGLLMTPTTRERLHGARVTCLLFLQGQRTEDDLVDAFYNARRYLRADLEMIDDRSPENLRSLTKRMAAEDKAADLT